MLKTIIEREIQNNLYSLRFQISFFLTVGVFVAGTISFLKSYDARMQKHSEYQVEFEKQLKKSSENNATKLAVNRREYVLQPNESGFISDCKEKYLPNSIRYNAFNVFSFQNQSGSVNPFLNHFQELNWYFIIALVLSFTVMLFTFDTISGEKEFRTLAVTLSNSVSRGKLLLGKYISTLIATILMVIIGLVFSILILLISNKINFSFNVLTEILGFLFVVFLFLSCVTAFGMFSSVLSRNSNISLLISLAFWLTFMVVIPNSSMFLAKNIFPIEHADAVDQKIETVQDDINRNAPEGSWASSGNNPFLPEHELRAANQMKLLNAEINIRNAYFQDMFRQYEMTRLLTSLSPVALFEYMTEAVVGGGYVRFKKIWQDMHIYQTQFLQFFEDFDAADPESPHWYNPVENLSTTRKPVKFETVPIFKEKAMTLFERFAVLTKYLIVIIIYTGIVFFLSFVLFVKYDVR